MTENRKSHPHFNNGLGGFPPGYKRIEIYSEEEMTIKTTTDLTPTNITHLKKFKEFLEEIVKTTNTGIDGINSGFLPLDNNIGSESLEKIKKECIDYIFHIDALLGK